jgi:transcriptional regulator with XRE-family HTH domain
MSAAGLGFLALGLKQKLLQLKMSLRELARETDLSYEGIRKIVGGDSVPSNGALRRISDVLGLEYAQVHKLAVADRVRMRFGADIWRQVDKDPSLEPFYILLPYLTEEQRRNFLSKMEVTSRFNRFEKKERGRKHVDGK